jgi:hypothetical protein
MDNEDVNCDHNASVVSKGTLSAKLRAKERLRLDDALPSDTDINDPENLDYDDEDDATKIDESSNTKRSDETNQPSALLPPVQVHYGHVHSRTVHIMSYSG